MESKKKNTIAKIIIIIAIILILLGILLAVFKNHDSKEKTYYATFVVDGVEYQSDIVIQDGYISRLPDPPKKDGYVFDHWEINGQEYTGNEKLTSNATLTAVFKKVEENQVVIITFKKENGEEDSTVAIIKNERVAPISEPKKEGHEFIGWFLNDEEYSFDTLINENITLIAKWKTLSYTVKFDSAGGNKINSQEIKYGNKVETPKLPTKTGYKFLGWYLNNKKYDFDTEVTQNITLIAKWEKAEEKIAYGDVNEDGMISLEDIMKLSNHINKGEKLTEQGKKNADINADGKLNMVDVNLISKVCYDTSESNEKILPLKSPIKDYVLYGDVTEDGVIDKEDSSKIGKYLEMNEKISEQGKKNADVNEDEKVNYVDIVLINGYISGYFEQELINEPIKNYILYGDLNDDGLLTNDDYNKLSSYISNNTNISEQAKKNADVDGNGKIDDVDLKNLKARLDKLAASDIKYNSGRIASLNPIVDYDNNHNNTTSTVYGDVNEDKEVDMLDIVELQDHLKGNINLSDQAKKNADVNGDGKINNVDVYLLMAYHTGAYKNTLPTSPIKDYVMYGDVNEDGEIHVLTDGMKIASYLNNNVELSEQAKKNADVNADGKINMIDVYLIQGYTYGGFGCEQGENLPSSPIKDYVMYGDVNEDGIVDLIDSVLLDRYLNENETISVQGKKNADVNADGSVNSIDLQLLDEYLTEVDDNSVPDNPLS